MLDTSYKWKSDLKLTSGGSFTYTWRTMEKENLAISLPLHEVRTERTPSPLQ
jgi:hypothetical protein